MVCIAIYCFFAILLATLVFCFHMRPKSPTFDPTTPPTMAANPKRTKDAPSASTTAKQSDTCAIEDGDYQESLSEFKDSSFSSIRIQPSASIAQRSNLSLMLEREEKGAKEAKEAKARAKKAANGEHTGDESTEQRHELQPPLRVTDNKRDNQKQTEVQAIKEETQQWRHGLFFLTEVYHLDKQKPSEEDRRFWSSHLHRSRNIW